MTTTSDTPMDDTQLADEAAPLDALLVDAALGPLRRFAPNASTVRFAARLARLDSEPAAAPRRAGVPGG
jgi:polyhydroxyalkanoate synthase subunit PhaC